MKTSFEKNENSTATYYETIDFYRLLAEKSDLIQLTEWGMTDQGKPLHEVVIDGLSRFDLPSGENDERTILFINNAIHPGEPCGVDATMMLARDIASGKTELPSDLTLVIIPFYNIGGGLNRGSHSRANQLGPEAYGFRGNARHLDLNRDFLKCDSRNAQSFNQLFNRWKPHVMIDNHTSNGADYQYVMTLIATQKDKLAPEVSKVMVEDMLPALYEDMKNKDYEMTPYVHARNTPDEGIAGFLDYARYSSGYAALHHTISFMPETHMLKPYRDRVYSTYGFMSSMIDYLRDEGETVRKANIKAYENYCKRDRVPLDWQLDPSRIDSLLFKGYEARYKPSDVSGHSRLYYDHGSPYEKEIPFYNSYKPVLEVERPQAYVIPQAYHEVKDRLEWNGVQIDLLEKDTVMSVQAYYVVSFKDQPAYEGHYWHTDIKVKRVIQDIQFYAGDFIVKTDQASCRYIMETLEPQAPDGFFAWNFFDGILMQKEYFSPYVFEDLAAKIIEENTNLRSKLEEKRQSDPEFAADGYAQLEFIYKNSPYYEESHNRVPVYRVLE
ncbi:MAG: hypothetical protein R3275_03420 [Saprospiraceae bacterium]|nr:hypothetical protein [Saprospiraceae bacterium]